MSHAVRRSKLKRRDDHHVIRAEDPRAVGLEGAKCAGSDDRAEEGQDPVAGRHLAALRMRRDREHDKGDERGQDQRAAIVQPRVRMGRKRDCDERRQHDHAEQPPSHGLQRRRALAVGPLSYPAATAPPDEYAHHRRC